jgi:hypothetical protein
MIIMAGTRMVPRFDESYWEDLKRTAHEVAGWPEWKKGEIGVSTPTTSRWARESTPKLSREEYREKTDSR